MGLTKVNKNYQITIPKDIIELEALKIGDIIALTKENGVVKLKRFDNSIFEKTFGSWNVKDSVKYVRKIRDEAEKREKGLGL